MFLPAAYTNAPGRPPKRLRVLRESHLPSAATVALLERLNAVRSESLRVREAHQTLIDDYDERLRAKHAAAKAATRVQPARIEQKVAVFTKGLVASNDSTPATRHGAPNSRSPPKSAMALLFEQEPTEKSMVEQSVMRRAQLINKRNAELARERLPKQPEAQRNKTYWDYFLDEATWLANDYREERKWKMQTARKVSKMVLQYHSQLAQKQQKAEREEQLRIIRLANKVARDVKTFWNQVREIAEYRESVKRDARLAVQRRHQLKFVLEQAEAYTNVLIKSYGANNSSKPVQDMSGDDSGYAQSQQSAAGLTNSLASPERDRSRVPARKRLRRDFESSNQTDYSNVHEQSKPDAEFVASHASSGFEQCTAPEPSEDNSVSSMDAGSHNNDDADDEASLSADEAGEERDPDELQHLNGDANVPIEELLRQQGIDPAAYAEDRENYMSSESSPSHETHSAHSSSSEEQFASLAGDRLRVAFGSEESPPEPIDDSQPRDSPNGDAATVDKTCSAKDVSISKEGIKDMTLANGAVDPRDQRFESHVKASRGDPACTAEMNADERSLAAPSRPFENDRHRFEAAARLLQGCLRDYQIAGLNWLVSMYESKLNGILADEMGLGKTIQTIALLAWLAVEHGIWGPHLVVVPTSVILNWEVEFKKWLPGFKVLTYFGSFKERKIKRRGWFKPNVFHVCITSYSLVVQDATALRRKRWSYLILDEAHNIKNFQSQRWQTLLNFRAKRRLLLTGTPLQNSVMELWSLMHFLMPEVFRSHTEFKELFSKPLTELVSEKDPASSGMDTAGTVSNLHRVLRPFILRRLKADVERNLPRKHEHVVFCPLSKRQRQLYEDFLSRGDTKETLDSGDFFGVMNVLMQLRKVCNHPDLFEGRPILSPLHMPRILYPSPRCVAEALEEKRHCRVDVGLLGMNFVDEDYRGWPGQWFSAERMALSAASLLRNALAEVHDDHFLPGKLESSSSDADSALRVYATRAAQARRAALRRNANLTDLRVRQRGLVGGDIIAAVTMSTSRLLRTLAAWRRGQWDRYADNLVSAVRNMSQVTRKANLLSELFVVSVHPVVASSVEMRYQGDDRRHRFDTETAMSLLAYCSPLRGLFRSYDVRSKVRLPDTRLVQWDCGKLQVLDKLLRKLKSEKHRVLIFTQMTRVLDVLETFLNLHAHRYLRLDGSTGTEERQKLVERFNTDSRVFCMILMTRAGGLGLNLVGADTVIFYDTDYNPSMDAQAQDRAHRIGQTRPVHIYRLVSQQTVEENILLRAQQKRTLESLVISDAGFTDDMFRKELSVMSLVRPRPESHVDTARDAVNDHGAVERGRADSPPLVKDVEVEFHASASKRRSDLSPGKPGTKTLVGNSGSQSNSTDRHQYAPTDAGVPGAALRHAPGQQNVGQLTRSRVYKDPSLGEGEMADGKAASVYFVDEEEEDIIRKQQTSEEQLNKADFEDSEAYQTNVIAKVTDCDDEGDAMDIEAKLSPIQRYALRFVEFKTTGQSVAQCAWNESSPSNDESAAKFDEWQKQFPVEEMIRRHERCDMSPSESDCNADDNDKFEETLCDLHYEMETTEEGREAYLKALTDTDADIKIYLPLRGGDPEELKKSTVLSGAAAAGLESAEDAAFFPHAYNRMSRTPFATRRQKEKAAANAARKREEERRLHASVKTDAAELRNRLSPPNQTSSDATSEKGKPSSKVRGSTLNGGKANAGVGLSKRVRFDAASRAKLIGASGATAVAAPIVQGSPEMTAGLFPKQVKKIKNKVVHVFQGKSGVNANTPVSREEIGLNDGWTTSEEQRLLELVAAHSKNMPLVADGMSLDPHVAAGHRLNRGEKRCIDRMRTLTKDVKSGAPVCRATENDSDTMKRHSRALIAASERAHARPPIWLKPSKLLPSEPHASHQKVASEAMSANDRPLYSGPPIASVVNAWAISSDQHRPGFKPSECTPAAMTRKRRPFTKSRAMGERRSAASLAQGSSKNALAPVAGTSSKTIYNNAGLNLRGHAMISSSHKSGSHHRPSGQYPTANASTNANSTRSHGNMGTVHSSSSNVQRQSVSSNVMATETTLSSHTGDFHNGSSTRHTLPVASDTIHSASTERQSQGARSANEAASGNSRQVLNNPITAVTKASHADTTHPKNYLPGTPSSSISPIGQRVPASTTSAVDAATDNIAKGANRNASVSQSSPTEILGPIQTSAQQIPRLKPSE